MTVPVLPPGRIVAAKYTIQSLLGRHVWAATHMALTSPNREVALKILSSDMGSRTEVIARLRRLDDACAKVPEHLALRTIDRGMDAGTGAPFMVTPLSGRPSLAQLIEICPLQLNEMLVLTRNLCAALDAAHANNLLHLAIKPANIFVGPSPELSVQLADFGANMLRLETPDEARLAFSAPWLAPEQVVDDDHGDRAADVFAAALVAFASVTGKSFWRCWNRPEGNVESWLEEVIGERASVSARAAETGVSLSRALDEVFARALSADRRARFASAGDFAKALEAASKAPVATFSAANASAPHVTPSPPVAVLPPFAFLSAANTEVSTATNVEASLAPPPTTKRSSLGKRVATATAAVVLLAGVGLAVVWSVRGHSKSSRQQARQEKSVTEKSAPQPTTMVISPPMASSDPSPTASEKPRPLDGQSELIVVCVPTCEAVAIDGTMYSEYPAPARLSPGTHAIGVSRRYFNGDWRRITLRPGEKRTMTFHLFPKQPAD
jgi:serine/threonine-protein kinase